MPFAHKIFVSIDGGNALSHDLNRGPGTFRKTMKGLKTLLAHVEATGADHLEIGIYQIDLGEPESEYDPEFLDLIERVDDHVKVKPPAARRGGTCDRADRREWRATRR